jgi:hypothetical protein
MDTGVYMRIVVVVLGTAEFFARQKAWHPNISFRRAETPADVIAYVIRERVDGVIIEVPSLKENEIPVLAELSRYPSVPTVWYGVLSAGLGRVVIENTQWGNPRLVLEDFNDHLARMSAFLMAQPPVPMRLRLMRWCETPLRKLKPAMAGAVLQRMHAFWERETTSWVAERCGLSARHVCRCMVHAGFVEPHFIFEALLIVDAHVYARDAGFRWMDVVRKLGLSDTDVLDNLLHGAAGVASRAEFVAMTPEALMDFIFRRLKPGN